MQDDTRKNPRWFRRLHCSTRSATKPGMLAMILAGLAATAMISACAAPTVAGTSSSGASAGASTKGPGVDKKLRSMLPASIRSSGVLKIATTTSNAPMDFATANGTPEGFDIDLATAAAKLLGVKPQFFETEFNGLIAAELSGRSDVIWGAMNDNATREAQVTFVDYFKHGFSLLVPKGNPQNITSISDFCGHTFAEEQGSVFQTLVPQLSQQNCTSKGKPAIKISIYPDNPSTFQALSTKRVDAIMAAQEQVAYEASINQQLQQVPSIDLDVVHYGVGIKPGNTQLVTCMKATVQKLIQDGTYAAIAKKWKLQAQAIPAAVINQPSA